MMLAWKPDFAAVPWRRWFSEMWPRRGRDLLGQFAAIGQQHKLFLADLALRGGVYDEDPPSGEPIAIGIWIGRRQLALETIKLCGAPPEQLFALIETSERKPRGEIHG